MQPDASLFIKPHNGIQKPVHLCVCAFAVAFRMYDLNGDGYVSSEELAHTLKTLMGRALSDAQLGQIVESTILQHDTDGDGRLSFQEFMSLLNAADTENKLCTAF